MMCFFILESVVFPAHLFPLIGKTNTHKDDLYRHSDSEPLPLFRSY